MEFSKLLFLKTGFKTLLFHANDAEPLAVLEKLKAIKESKGIPFIILKPPNSYTL